MQIGRFCFYFQTKVFSDSRKHYSNYNRSESFCKLVNLIGLVLGFLRKLSEKCYKKLVFLSFLGVFLKSIVGYKNEFITI